jgi:hypothetical protein
MEGFVRIRFNAIYFSIPQRRIVIHFKFRLKKRHLLCEIDRTNKNSAACNSSLTDKGHMYLPET